MFRVPSNTSLGNRFSCLILGLCCLGGCVSPWFSKEADPKTPEAKKARRQSIKDILESEDRPRLVADIASPRLLTLSRVENVALVTRLHGTGGPVSASPQREKLLDTMRKLEINQPNALLDDPNTTMVVAFVNLPPAARKGTVHNVGVRLSQHAQSTSLKSGWLMRTTLAENRALGGQLREGFDLAAAAGPIVTQAQVTGSQDPEEQLTGFVIGGAKLFKERSIGIGFSEEFTDAITQAAVLPAINDRFTVFNGIKQGGIATPRSDSYIELMIPKNYELDPFHFLNVVLHLGFAESPEHRAQRIELCRKQLQEPTTVRVACWQLEGIGKDAIPVIASALDNPDPEVRFYAAHSLAYLNDGRAIAPLAELARQVPAFRAMCFSALSIMDHYQADDALTELLHVADVETRYGALLALRYRDPGNALVNGFPASDVGTILEVPSQGPPVVAVSLENTSEVVIFGTTPQLNLPSFVKLTDRMVLTVENGTAVTISHFEPNEEDRVVRCSNDLRSVLQAIAEAGGGYGDWVSFLRECRDNGYLAEPLAMNPIPVSGRSYDRDVPIESEPGEYRFEETITAEIAPPEKPSAAWYSPRNWFESR